MLAISVMLASWVALRGGILAYEPDESLPFSYRLQQRFSITTPVSDKVAEAEERPDFEPVKRMPNRLKTVVARQAYETLLQDEPHDRGEPAEAVSPWFAARAGTERPWSSGTSKRLEAYLFSFWRGNGTGSGLAPVAQYGGSQTGAIFRYRLSDSKLQPKLSLRAVYTPPARLSPASSEIAVGVSARPLAPLPVDLTVERRFVDTAPDKFVIYAAGGRDNIKLPQNFRLSTFGQVGSVADKEGRYFYDFVTRAERPIIGHGRARLHGGAGGWAGGQKGVGRLDIGPTIQAELPIGRNIVRLYADYRVRVAGNAVPGNGPALTVVTGF